MWSRVGKNTTHVISTRMTSIKVPSLSFERIMPIILPRGFKCNLKAMHATIFEMHETNLTRMQMCYRSTSCV